MDEQKSGASVIELAAAKASHLQRKNDAALHGFGKSGKRIAKRMENGTKITRQEAFGALMEMKNLMDGMLEHVQRLSQAIMGHEQTLHQMDAMLGVLLKVLHEKGVLTDEQWDVAWDKHVLAPQRAEMDKAVEELRTKSAEDAYFAHVIDLVKAHTFEPQVVEGNPEPITNQQQKDFFVRALLTPHVRKRALNELKTKLTVPDYTPPQGVDTPEQEVKHPDCHYCGKPECAYCSTHTRAPEAPIVDESDSTDFVPVE